MVKPVQTTTSVKLPMLSPTKQIPIQLILSNATSNHFFLLPNEKKLVNNNCKTLSSKGTQKKHKKKYI